MALQPDGSFKLGERKLITSEVIFLKRNFSELI